MPRYFFDTHNGDILMKNVEGVELPSRENAREQALAGLGSIAKDETPDGDQRICYVNVRDRDGRAIYTACMSLVGRWLD